LKPPVKTSVIYRLLSLILLLVATTSHSEQSTANQLKIIYAGYMNEISSDKKNGYAAVASLLKEHRQQEVPTFFFFGGGSIGPSMLSAFDRGSHIIDLLNAIEPDVMAVSKREFSFYEDELSLRSYEAAFPFVASNTIEKITNKPLDGLVTSVITQQGAYKIGVLSTMSHITISEYNLKRINILNKVKAVKKTRYRAEKRKC
jgi:5'-nucleotidase/UDP-sugar diphosphatase